jgi:predicted metal-dependent phosphoesterase TrpH
VGADDVERRTFGRQGPTVLEPAEAQRTKTVRVANTDDVTGVHRNERISTGERRQHLDERLLQSMLFVVQPLGSAVEKLDHQIAVASDGARQHTGVFGELSSVGEIAVVPQSKTRALGARAENGLRIAPGARPGGRVARMANGEIALQRGERTLVEHVGNEAHVTDDSDGFPVAHGHSGGFLPTMLQGVEPVIRQESNRTAGRVDTEDSTGISKLVAVLVGVDILDAYRGRSTVRTWSFIGSGHWSIVPQLHPQKANPYRSTVKCMAVDLHTHSERSDGSDTPVQLVELAAAANLEALSLTDHDTIDGLPAASLRAAELDIAFLPGIELSVHTSSKTIHLLGYGFDPTHPELVETLKSQQDSRLHRNTLLIERLVALGYEITLEEVVAKTDGGTIGRPHFASVLVDKGYVTSIDQAFTELLAGGRPAYIERRELPAADAIALIHRAGGAAIWAHPTRTAEIDENRFRSELEELLSVGLDGFECWYSRFSPELRRRMARIARKYGVIPTGGSDYHGSYKPDLSIGSGTGDLQIPFEVFEELRDRAQNFSE